MDIHKVMAHCDSRNGASERVMIKSGMQKEALSRKDRYINDEWSDSLQYSILHEEWAKLK